MHVKDLNKVNTLVQERSCLLDDLDRLVRMGQLTNIDLENQNERIEIADTALLSGLHESIKKVYADRVNEIDSQLEILGIDMTDLVAERLNKELEEDISRVNR